MKKTVLTFFAFALFCAGSVQAATFPVTTSTDAGPGSYRQAVLDANALAGTDTIVFDAATNGVPISLVTTVIVDEGLVILGNGSVNTVFDLTAGGGLEFSIGVASTIEDLGIENNTTIPMIVSFGGAGSSIIIRGCVFSNATSAVPNIELESEVVNIDSCAFEMLNSTSDTPIVIEPLTSLSITRSSFSNNSGNGSGAMQILAAGTPTLTLENCVFDNNTGTLLSGAVEFSDILTGNIANCTFSNNSGFSGGGISDLSTDLQWDMTNTILANNSPTDLHFTGSAVTGIFANNVVETCDMPSATCPTWFSTSDPLLGTPQQCGIFTYVTPGFGSDAVDNGSAGLLTDICGTPYGIADIGAVSVFTPGAIGFGTPLSIVETATNAGIEEISNFGFTMEAWVYAGANGVVNSIIRKEGDYSLYTSGGVLTAQVWADGSTNMTQFTGPSGFPLDVWTHVAFTWDGTDAFFYVNAVQTAGVNAGTSVNASTANFCVGESTITANEMWNGSIDEVRLWKCVKTQIEIETDTSAVHTGSETGLLLFYDFSDGTGTTVTDLSSNGNDGTLSNGATWVTGVQTTGTPTFIGCPEPVNNYWVGGPGDWSDASNHWANTSGGTPGSVTVPNAGNNAIFDDNSGLALTTDVVNMDTPATVDTINYAAVSNAFVFNGNANDLTINHSFIGNTAGATFTGTWGEYVFNADSTGESITSGGTVFVQDFHFDGNEAITLNDDLNISSGTMIVDSGGVILNGNNLVCSEFSSLTTSPRNIDISNATIDVLLGNWEIDSTGLIFDANSSLISMNDNASTANFSGGSLTYDTIRSLTATTFSYANNNSINLLELVTSSQLNINNGDTLNIDSLVAIGDCGAPVVITIPSAGANGTINNISTSDFNFEHFSISGVDAAAPANYTLRLSDTSNASGWTLGSTNFYWVNDGGNWNDVNQWSFTSGGLVSGCLPSFSDSTFFDANSFTAAGFAVTIDDTAFFRSMDWTGSTGAQMLSLDSSLWAYGDVTLAPNVSVLRNTIVSGLAFWNQAEFDPANAALIDITINITLPMPSDTVLLMDELTMTDSSTISLFNGTFNTQSFDINTGSINSVDNPLDLTDARTIDFGASNINLISQFYALNDNDLTFDAGTSVLRIGDTLGYPNNLLTEGLTFNDVILDFDPANVTGLIEANTVQGNNNYSNLKILGGSEVFFESASTQTISDSLVMRGTCLDSIFISSLDTIGVITQANIFKSVDSASVRAECLNVAGMNASGFGITAFFSSDLVSNNGFTFSAQQAVTADIGIDSTNSSFCWGDTITFTNSSSSFYTPFAQLENEWFINDGSFPILDSASTVEASKTSLTYNGNAVLGEHETIPFDSLITWNEITDPINLFEPSTGEATTSTDNELLNYKFTVGYRIEINNVSGDTAYLVDMDDSASIVTYSYKPTFQLSQDSNQVSISPANHIISEFDSILPGLTTLANDTITFTMSSPSISPGQNVSVLTGMLLDTLGYPTKPRWRDSNSVLANDVLVDFSYFIDTIHIEVSPATNGLDTNSFATVIQTSGFGIETTIQVQDPETFCISRDTLLIDVINPNISVISSQPDLELCPEDSVIFQVFSAIPDSIGITSFEFFLNGTSVAPASVNDTLRTFTNVNNNDTISVLSYQDGCTSDTMPSFIFTVFATPTLNFTSSEVDTTICSGDLVNFSAWSADSLNQFSYELNGIGVTPFQDSLATYTTSILANGDVVNVNVIDSNNCGNNANMVFVVDSLPTVLLTESTGGNVICANDEVTFTASGSNSYEFFVDGVSVQGLSTNATYVTDSLVTGDTVSVRGTNLNGCTEISSTIFTYFVTSVPPVTLTSTDADSSICSFELVTFTGGGAASYQFFINDILVQGPGTNSTYTPSSLSDNDTITVIGGFAGCSAESSPIIMEVFTAPTTSLSNDDVGGDNIICQGTPVEFTASGADSYEFFVDGTNVQGPSPTNTYNTSSLTNGQVMTVTGTSNGCLVSQNQTFTVLINPIVDLFSNDGDNTICENDAIEFTGSNAATYEFFIDGTSVQGPSSDFTLTNPTIAAGPHTVFVTGTAGNGCTDDSPAISLTVNATPTISLTSSATNDSICAGETVVFTGSGGDQYQFFLGGTSQGNLSPTSTFSSNSLLNGQTVTVVGSLLGCSSTSIAITTAVSPVPTVSVTSTDVDNIYCDGDPVDYTASGANTYEFLLNTVSQGPPSPVSTINSSGFGTGPINLEVIGEINGCFDTLSTNIVINTLPAAGLISSVPTNSICSGELVTYTASGGFLYEFFVSGLSQGTLSPNSTFSINSLADNDIVSVVASSNTGCTDTLAFAPISVSPFPTATIISTDTLICNGEQVDFTAGGASDYEFFINNVSQGAPSPVNTFSTTGLNNGDVVTVAGTDAGCSANSSNIVFVVYGFPVVDLLNNGDSQICVGETTDLVASGATNYEFFVNGSSQGAPSPVTTFNGVLNNGDIVTVEGETNGCASNGNNAVAFTVFNFPTLSTSTSNGTTICFGDTVTVTGSGALTYEFEVNGTLAQQGASSTFTTATLENGDQISVTGYNGDCPSTPDTYTFNVNTMLLSMTVAPDEFICEGENAVFTASGADEYQFYLNGLPQGVQGTNNTFSTSTLVNEDQVTFIGFNTTTMCEQPLSDFIIMNVIDAPTITGSPTTFCEGDSVVLLSNIPYGNQWLLDGTPIAGAIDTLYVATVGGDYSLDATIGGQGDLWSVGQNATGIFGDATNFNAASPTPANSTTTFDEISAGFGYILGVSSTGELYAWGENSSGQLGNGTYTSANVPQLVPTLSNVKTAATTENSSVAVTDAGDLYVWGNNSQGQLGTGNSAVINFPFLNTNIDNVDSVAAGRDHYVFLRNDGTVWAVGDNSAGQLGQGSISDSILTPIQVPGLANIVAVGAGEYNSFAISTSNELYVWGNNGSGQLGLGDLNNRVLPTLSDLDNVIIAQGGASHSIFLTADMKVFTSGNNSFGQLGTGNLTNNTLPVLVDLPGATAISAGQYTSLVQRSDASVFGFGTNTEQQLSTIPQTVVSTPTHISNVDGVTVIEASAFSSHFLYGTEQTCAATSVTVTVNPTPMVTISENNGVLTVTPAVPGATYQWFLNGNPIVAPNPTDPSIPITTGGEYSVEVTSTEGCLGGASYTSTLEINDLSISDVYLFPNPAQDLINIQFGTYTSQTEIIITDQTGRIVLVSSEESSQLTSINVSELATGVYNVVVTNDMVQTTLRFVKGQN